MNKILLSLLLAILVATPAFSQMSDTSMKGHKEGHGEMKGMCDMDRCNMDMMGDMMGMCLKHAEAIGLADDQMAKLKPVHTEMQKKQARFTADAKIAEIELREIMEVRDFDLEKATAAVTKIADIKRDHHLEMIKSMKEVRTLLTDEQFAKMKKLMPMMTGEPKPQSKGKK